MAADLKLRAKEAFVDDNFELAVELYTKALDMDPNNGDLFADRAQTNIKLENFTEAVADANRAIELDPSMSKAYLRKGTACMKLEEFQTAKSALEAGMALALGDSRFTKLIKECDERIAGHFFNPQYMYRTDGRRDEYDNTSEVLMGAKNVIRRMLEDENRAILACKQMHDYRLMQYHFGTGTAQRAVKILSPEETGGIPRSILSTEPSASPPSETASESANKEASLAVAPVKPKYRHDYYNSPTEVVLTIFAKGVPSENVLVDFGEQILSVSIEVPDEEPYHFQPRLFGKIIPSKCSYTVLPSKIEIRLSKDDAITWTSLEFTKEKVVPQKTNVISGPASVSHRPTYPSSKSKTDWDRLEAEVKREEKEEKLEGDAALNKLFRDIYKDADEDMRRAMQKSFVESNGTVLSTNWKEVGAQKVEGTPPDGMELKKWEY